YEDLPRLLFIERQPVFDADAAEAALEEVLGREGAAHVGERDQHEIGSELVDQAQKVPALPEELASVGDTFGRLGGVVEEAENVEGLSTGRSQCDDLCCVGAYTKHEDTLSQPLTRVEGDPHRSPDAQGDREEKEGLPEGQPAESEGGLGISDSRRDHRGAEQGQEEPGGELAPPVPLEPIEVSEIEAEEDDGDEACGLGPEGSPSRPRP